ncbi:hypothetical protein [Chitinophaga rhizophila]|uniref:Uncharacterized protein n=1 Tax=Chitinophaga rhizophila TaxID=2866212 RepID=A0ABS7GEH0_9BACT|nr:hypothetical protein [Chitinophaga rhizophila]MBW8685680.1 hypothetical protein [Chitinophaga rhizophila]
MNKLLSFLILYNTSIAIAKGQVLNPYNDFGYVPRNKYISTAPGYVIENKDATDSTSRMVIDVEKGEVRLYSRDSIVLSQTNISSRDILRFLSVDPLTTKFPELTPYQFASNRPLDGIDLDGLEWYKSKTYDPKSGITNVDFQVKLKLKNESEVFKDLEGLRNEIIKQFPGVFKDVRDGNTTYSASISVEFVDELRKGVDFGTALVDDPNTPGGGLTTFINTKVNANTVNPYDSRSGVAPNTPRDAATVARDILHELIHTAGPNHTDDVNQATDIQIIATPIMALDGSLIRVDRKIAPGASLDLIIHNIMSYPGIKLEGKKISEYVPNKFDRSKVSPGQVLQIINQIDIDEQ